MRTEEWIDRAIDAGATLDWIGPLWTFAQDLRHAPSTGFNVAVDSGWSAYALRDVLKGYQIANWGWYIYGDVILFRVECADADNVYAILAGLGAL